jgi:hypothetical protein
VFRWSLVESAAAWSSRSPPRVAKGLWKIERNILDTYGVVRKGSDTLFTDVGKAEVESTSFEDLLRAYNKASAAERLAFGRLQTKQGHRYSAADLARLKAEMVAAHPDKGGNNEAFHKARVAYVKARREARP